MERKEGIMERNEGRGILMSQENGEQPPETISSEQQPQTLRKSSGKRFKVCFWATTFQSDIHSFAMHLDKHPDYDIIIAMERPENFRKDGVQQLLPINARILDAGKYTTLAKLKLFRPEALITDNHFPPIGLGKNLLVLWHGFGWRMDNLSGEFEHVHNNIKRLVGSSKESNPNFIWQCYGPGDLKYRYKISGFHPDNLQVFGSAQADDIRNVKIRKEDVAQFYSIDILTRPTVMLGFTWHHGKVLSHWGEDTELYRELFAFAEEIGVNLIIRMHDSFRYDASYIKELEDLVKGNDNVMLKFKDTYQDNLIDILISDVMVSNYSSIINRFYLTGKPSIHIYPVREGKEKTIWRHLGDDGELVEDKVSEDTYGWKFPPDMIGGFMVDTMDELKEKIRYSLEHPECCKDKSEAFIRDHMGGLEGQVCERIEKSLRKMING